MRIDLLTKFAKRAMNHQQHNLHDSKIHAYNALTTSFHSLAKTRVPQTMRRFTNQFFQKSSAYSSSASSNQLKNTSGGFIAWYLGMLETRPVLTKAVSASLICGAADLSSQRITMSPSDSFDLIRTMRMAGYGLVISGPVQHLWFNFAARVLPNRDVLSTVKKLLMGQLLLGPVVLSVFFSFNAALQGETVDEIAARLKRDMIPALVNGFVFWPVCDFLTYKIIPVHLQPLVNGTFAYVWSIYLTYMASLEKPVAE